MAKMRVLRYQYQGAGRVVHSIGISEHPGEFVIELDNFRVVECMELLQLGLRESPKLIIAIRKWRKFHSDRLYDDVIDRWGFANDPYARKATAVCGVRQVVLCSGKEAASTPPGYYASKVLCGGW